MARPDRRTFKQWCLGTFFGTLTRMLLTAYVVAGIVIAVVVNDANTAAFHHAYNIERSASAVFGWPAVLWQHMEKDHL